MLGTKNQRMRRESGDILDTSNDSGEKYATWIIFSCDYDHLGKPSDVPKRARCTRPLSNIGSGQSFMGV